MRGVWVRKPKDSVVLVFIHGVLSSTEKCWTNADGVSWPSLVCLDKQLDAHGVYTFSYKTGVMSGDYGISDAADALKEHFRLDGLHEFEKIVFVCHSLGGIVARKYIVDRAADLTPHSVGLFLLGSPSLGSQYASAFAILSRAFGNLQGASLKFIGRNPWLDDLHKNFRNLKESRALRITGKELVEDVGPHWPLSTIVKSFSAATYFGESFKVPDSTHSTLSKPTDLSAIQHRLLAQFVLEFRGAESLEKPREKNYAVSDPLFEVYSRASAHFYLTREYDDAMQRAIKHSSLWIHGQSGVGKTSLVKRFIDSNSVDPAPIEISLSILGKEVKKEQILKEIYDSMAAAETGISRQPHTNDVVQQICKLDANVTLALFIDEIAGADGEYGSEATDTIAALLDGVKRAGRNDIRIVACSIAKPSPSNQGRFQEQFGTISMDRWSLDELNRLAVTIQEALPEGTVQDEWVRLAIDRAKGSPRFVKTFFRNVIRLSSEGILNFELTLAQTEDALKGM